MTNRPPAFRASCFVIVSSFLLRHSINVLLRQRESVAQNLQPRLRAFRDDHFDNIEAEKNIRIIQQPQPRQAAARNSIPFIAIHRIQRPSKILPRPRFHFDEHERVAIPADNVDLAAGAPSKITIQDFVTVLLQEPAGQVFPARPKPQMPGLRIRRAAAPPVRKIGDVSDKARVHAV